MATVLGSGEICSYLPGILKIYFSVLRNLIFRSCDPENKLIISGMHTLKIHGFTQVLEGLVDQIVNCTYRE
jgi:hypothetical protein